MTKEKIKLIAVISETSRYVVGMTEDNTMQVMFLNGINPTCLDSQMLSKSVLGLAGLFR